MFEMKNESIESATKKRNEDFLKELDKDHTALGLRLFDGYLMKSGCRLEITQTNLDKSTACRYSGACWVFDGGERYRQRGHEHRAQVL